VFPAYFQSLSTSPLANWSWTGLFWVARVVRPSWRCSSRR
jgi:hypothetical protein